MKKLLFLLSLASSTCFAAGSNKTLQQITFGDGTVQTTAASGTGGGGSGQVGAGTIGQNAYYAVNGGTVTGSSNMITNTSSETFNVTTSHIFGLSSSTGVYSSSVTAQAVVISSFPVGSAFLGYRPVGGFSPLGMYGVGTSSLELGLPISQQSIIDMSLSLTNINTPTRIVQNGNGTTVSPLKIFSNGNFSLALSSFQAGAISYTVFDNDTSNQWNAYSGLIVSTSTTSKAVYEIGNGVVESQTHTPYFDIQFSTNSPSTLGFIGIGVSTPVYQLDVSSYIHTNQGIVFPDSTIQTTAALGGGGDMVLASTQTSTGAKTFRSTTTISVLYFSTGSSVVQISTTSGIGVGTCGSNPSIRGGNYVGEVTFGTGAGLTSCIVSFTIPSPFTNPPICFYSAKNGNITPTSYSTTVLALTFNGTSLASDTIDYQCFDVK